MEGRLFTLVSKKHEGKVFAWGMEITSPRETEAVIYRKNPVTKQTFFGVHTTADAALRRYSRIHELRLVWEDGYDEDDD
jgi:hypothetical protein